MTTTKFATGAFVFSRACRVRPMLPADAMPIALRHGLTEDLVPPYDGDRAAIERVIAQADKQLCPIRAMLLATVPIPTTYEIVDAA